MPRLTATSDVAWFRRDPPRTMRVRFQAPHLCQLPDWMISGQILS
jgi:hypothetical protein